MTMTLAIIDNGTDGALALKKNMLSTNEKLALHSFGVAGEENPYEETIKPKKETSNKSTGSIAPEMSTTVEKEQEFPSDEKAADVAAAIAEKEGTIGAVIEAEPEDDDGVSSTVPSDEVAQADEETETVLEGEGHQPMVKKRPSPNKEEDDDDHEAKRIATDSSTNNVLKE